MDTPEPTQATDSTIDIPAELLRSLRGAAEQDLEWACDGVWDDERRDHVRNAVHILDAVNAGTCTAEQLARLASSAILWEEPRAGSWPKTTADVDQLLGRLQRVRQLIVLRDHATAQRIGS
jgi:hypothetical protein